MADNPRKLLYLSLTAKLSGISLIKTIGRWNGQIGNEDRERGLKTPNVLIQIENEIEGTRASGYELQQGWVYVTCHIGINVVKKDIGTLDWDIAQAIYEVVQGMEMPTGDYIGFTPFDRVDEKEDNNYDGYYHGRLIFKTYLKDATKCDYRLGQEQTSSIDEVITTKNVSIT